MPYPHLQRIQGRHREVIDLHLMGMSNADIAALSGMTEVAIRGILASPLIQDVVARRIAKIEDAKDEQIAMGVGEAKKVLEEHSADAARTLVELQQNAESESIRMQSANSILDKVFRKDDQSGMPPITLNGGNLVLMQQVLQEEREGRRKYEEQKALEARSGMVVKGDEDQPSLPS